MIAICKRPTKRLVKGVRYEVDSIWNDGTSQRWVEGKITIKDVGRFSVENFVDENGKALPRIKIVKPVVHQQRIVFSDLKEGEILVCDSENYKTLLKGGMYRIEKLVSETTELVGWDGTKRYYKEEHVKFEGVSRKLKFNNWNFRKLSPEESREIGLNSLLNGEEAPVIKSNKIKKIDLMANKSAVLIEALARSIVDPNRHHLTIPEWACEKVAPKLSLEKEDFDYLLDLPLREILNLMKK
jgi:hypothetical protein